MSTFEWSEIEFQEKSLLHAFLAHLVHQTSMQGTELNIFILKTLQHEKLCKIRPQSGASGNRFFGNLALKF